MPVSLTLAMLYCKELKCLQHFFSIQNDSPHSFSCSIQNGKGIICDYVLTKIVLVCYFSIDQVLARQGVAEIEVLASYSHVIFDGGALLLQQILPNKELINSNRFLKIDILLAIAALLRMNASNVVITYGEVAAQATIILMSTVFI
ncbi:hypothetical protein FGO68_gene17521 [Halteria grandinella]|uniref:Uncharacterized protein n=1 Tax=Halteria grandinella TaxID=5974 RepID=A0A8J8P3L1_HALGN|nr:hypothetical protein FGO68_gene17521 [Halteria grandinella]